MIDTAFSALNLIFNVFEFFTIANITTIAVYFFISVYIISLLLLVSSVIFIIGNFSYNNFRFIRHMKFYKNFFSLNFVNLASLVGIPPLAGFISKFLLLNNVNVNNNLIYVTAFFLLLLLSLIVYFQLIKHFKNFIKLNEFDLLVVSRPSKYKIYKLTVACFIIIIITVIFFKDFLFLLLLNI